jgi:hypothetical protein
VDGSNGGVDGLNGGMDGLNRSNVWVDGLNEGMDGLMEKWIAGLNGRVAVLNGWVNESIKLMGR